MFRTALRNVLAHKARLLMTVLAVMLGVAFVAGTLVFTSTIQDAFQKSSEKGFDHVDVAIQPEDPGKNDKNLGPAPNLKQQTLDEAAALPGAKSAIGIVSGFAGLSDKDGDLVGDGWGTTGANYYAGPDGKGSDHRYPLKDGRAPRNAGEIAIDSKTADRTGYKVGDKVPTSLSGPVRQEKVVGVFSTDDGSVAAGGSLVLFDNDTAQKLFAKPGEYTEIQMRAAGGTSQQQLEKATEKILPPESKAVTGKKLAEDQSKQIENQMSGMQTAMLAFAGIALFVGIFIIANTFTMLVAQRTKELALLRAVGASRRQVTRSVLIEATAVGSIAAVAGLAAGVGIAIGLRSLVGSLGEMPDGPLIVSPTTIVTALVVGVVVTVLAAWLPARRAAKIPPVAAMGAMHAPATTRSLIVRNSIGLVLAGGGAALVTAASANGENAMMGLGAGLLLIGVFVLTPLLSRPMIAATAPVLRLFNVSGKLARQNAVRNPRRTAATASALMIGLTLITGLTVIAGGVQQAIDKMASNDIKADYTISMANFEPLSPEVEQKLKSMDEVISTGAFSTTAARLDGKNKLLTGVDGSTVTEMTRLDFQSGSWEGLSGGKEAVVDDDTAKKFGWKVGSNFAVTYEDGAKGTLSVGGVYKGNALLNGVMVDEKTVAPHVSKAEDQQVMVKTKDGTSESVKNALEKGLGNNPAVLVQDKEDISDSVAQAISLLLNILYGLLAMAVIVAILGVVNTLAMSVFERGQEIGMLRAIGLDRRGIKRMVRLESLVISLFGGVLGIGLGVFLGWAAGELVASAGLDTYTLVLPWDRLAIFLLMAALVGVLAALWPARRAAKLNMLAAIKTE